MLRWKRPLLQLLPGPSDLELERQKTASLEQELDILKQHFAEYRTRAGKRLAEERVKGQQDACAIIMEMLDNLELSYRTLPQDLEDTSWLKGFLLLNKEFAIKLRTLGIVRFGKPMQQFDANRHEAVDITSSDLPDGTIIEVVKHGYLFRSGSGPQIVEKVLRPALVIVASQAAAKEKRRA